MIESIQRNGAHGLETDSTVFIAHGTGSQRSSRLLSMNGANALLKIEGGDGVVKQGEIVNAFLIGPL